MLIDTQLSGTTAQLASLGLLHKAIDSTNQEESLSRLSLELYTKLVAIGKALDPENASVAYRLEHCSMYRPWPCTLNDS